MDITILISSPLHPVYPRLEIFCEVNQKDHDFKLITDRSMLTEGEVLFLVSCDQIVSSDDRSKFSKSFVLHASDLPAGRGWSPHIWQVLEGRTSIVVTLLEAEDLLDTGDIWEQTTVDIARSALYQEINEQIIDAELELMQFVIDSIDIIEPKPQNTDVAASYYRKRTPQDSRVDVSKSIAEQFDIMRVSDPDRYPAFFELHDQVYKISIEKFEDEQND